MKKLLIGLLVGGKATRLGGLAKGLLPAPDTGEPLVARLVRLCRDGAAGADIVLVGEAGPYGVLGLPALADDPPGIGPLGALAALLADASARGTDALAVACDLPYMTRSLVTSIRLHAPDAPAVAPRPGGTWQPLFARYAAGECLPIARALVREGRLAARGILEALGERAVALPLEEAETAMLDDWDAPEDLRRRR
jgi:molybdopterin-guanine dinucleotide biosynthesis protein A